jgi:dihydroorotate dehydrogenase
MLEIFAKLDSILRPKLINLPLLFAARIYSPGRKIFVKELGKQKLAETINISDDYKQILWGIEFRVPLFNAAGMFKTGEGYYAMAAQGAGAFLAGTTTSAPRKGNKKNCILHPFLPLPYSKTAVNWMGLPNKGHYFTAKKLALYTKIPGCPIGASIAPDPTAINLSAATGLVEGLNIYERANVDFVEINESCPNVEHTKCEINSSGLDSGLIERLEFVSNYYIKKRIRKFPIIVKFSVDTKIEQIPELIKVLVDLGYDGANFGNTSLNYENAERFLHKREIKSFRKFTEKFGGGVSGAPLKFISLELAASARKAIDEINPEREFHIIRTGGIESIDDIENSKKNGIALNQWFTGYFEAFSKHGNSLYKANFK